MKLGAEVKAPCRDWSATETLFQSIGPCIQVRIVYSPDVQVNETVNKC